MEYLLEGDFGAKKIPSELFKFVRRAAVHTVAYISSSSNLNGCTNEPSCQEQLDEIMDCVNNSGDGCKTGKAVNRCDECATAYKEASRFNSHKKCEYCKMVEPYIGVAEFDEKTSKSKRFTSKGTFNKSLHFILLRLNKEVANASDLGEITLTNIENNVIREEEWGILPFIRSITERISVKNLRMNTSDFESMLFERFQKTHRVFNNEILLKLTQMYVKFLQIVGIYLANLMWEKKHMSDSETAKMIFRLLAFSCSDGTEFVDINLQFLNEMQRYLDFVKQRETAIKAANAQKSSDFEYRRDK